MLVNEYQPNEGIASHQDGPLYTNFVLRRFTLSRRRGYVRQHEDFKNFETVRRFRPKKKFALVYGKAYDCYLHGINNGGRGGGGGGGGGKGEDDEFVLENKRISLTFRSVKNLAIRESVRRFAREEMTNRSSSITTSTCAQ